MVSTTDPLDNREPGEVRAPPGNSRQYDRLRLEDSLNEPFQVATSYLVGTKPSTIGDGLETPLLVFANARSGGRAGSDITLVCNRALGRMQVFDLSTHRPDKVLARIWENFRVAEASGDVKAREVRAGLRILVAGGDGTIAWVLKVIKDLNLRPQPPVACMPLGTGNDLSRTFGWGGTFSPKWISSHEKIYYTLKRVALAREEEVDCWRIHVTLPRKELLKEHPHALTLVSPAGGTGRSAAGHGSSQFSGPNRQLGTSSAGSAATGFTSNTNASAMTAATIAAVAGTPAHTEAPSIGSDEGGVALQGMFWNYFSVGLDAKAAFNFHQLREHKPYLTVGQVSNKLWYSAFSCSSGWFCCTKPLGSKCKVQVQLPGGDTWKDLLLPPSVKAVVVLNLQSYAGGRNLWGPHTSEEAKRKHGYRQPSYKDGLLEVVGLTNGYHTGLVMASGGSLVHAMRICQAAAIRLQLQASYVRADGEPSHCYCQIDGEPWIQNVPSGRDDRSIQIDITHAGTSRMLLNREDLTPPPLAPAALEAAASMTGKTPNVAEAAVSADGTLSGRGGQGGRVNESHTVVHAKTSVSSMGHLTGSPHNTNSRQRGCDAAYGRTHLSVSPNKLCGDGSLGALL